MSLTTLTDFIGIMVPLMNSTFTWTNFKLLNEGKAPPIVALNIADQYVDGSGKTTKVGSSRGNKNKLIACRNTPGPPPEFTFDGSMIFQSPSGEIICKHTDNRRRDAMKADIINGLKEASLTFLITGIDDNPKRRNKEGTIFSIQILSC